MVLKAIFGRKRKSTEATPLAQAPSMGPKNQPPVAGTTPNEPPPAIYLEQALVENARQDNFETRRKVYQELLFSDLLLALAPQEPPADANGVPTTEATSKPINVAILKSPQGVHFVAAFTSSVAAKRWQPQGGHYAGVRGQDLFKLIEQSPAEVVVVNAGNSPMAVISKTECKQLATGLIPQVTKSPVQIPVANPQDPNAPPQGTSPNTAPGQHSIQISFPKDAFTEEQRNAVFHYLAQQNSVIKAALGMISQEKRGVFLKLSLDANTQGDAIQTLCAEFKGHIQSLTELFQDLVIEIGVMTDDNFWENLKKNNVPLFERS